MTTSGPPSDPAKDLDGAADAPPAGDGDLDALCEAAAREEPGAAERLFPLVYEHLRRIAARQMRQDAHRVTLQPTAVVHEAFLRLRHGDDRSWAGRNHFLSAAVRAIRHVLVDAARRRAADKRGGGAARVTLVEVATPAGDRGSPTAALDVLDLHAALAEYAGRDPRGARVAELRFFGGLSVPETAAVLGIAPATVKADWVVARVWLARRLGGEASR
ncbi:MAG: ECF-type sigma factor [Planctomycetota bacterium]